MAKLPQKLIDALKNTAPEVESRKRMEFTDIPQDLIIKYVLDWAESLGYNVDGLRFRDKDPSKGRPGIYTRLFEPDDKPRQPSSYLNIYFGNGIPTATIYRHKGDETLKWTPAQEPRLQGRNVPYKDEGYFSLSSGPAKTRTTTRQAETVAPISATPPRVEPVSTTEQQPSEAYNNMCTLYNSARQLAVREQLNDSYQSSGARYLLSKHVFFTALRYDKQLRVCSRGNLLVPFHDLETGRLVTLQKIYFDTRDQTYKKPWFTGLGVPGGRAWHLIQRTEATDKPGRFVLCEGLATGLSLYYHYRQTVNIAVCGDCNSLTKTGLRLLELKPDMKLYIAADNDIGKVAKTGRNAGVQAAEAVKAAAPNRVFINCPRSPDGRSIDFNDLYGGE